MNSLHTSLRRISIVALSCLVLVGTDIAAASAATAPRDAELRNTVAKLRDGGDESVRNATLAALEQLSRRYPDDPYVGVQLANAYGLQAHYAKTRDDKAVWGAKAEAVLDQVSASNPNYLLADATRGVQMVMAPAVLGLEARGEQQLKRVIAVGAGRHGDDDVEAVITAHLFLARLYDRQAKALSGDAQLAKQQAAEQVRAGLKQQFPKLDVAGLDKGA